VYFLCQLQELIEVNQVYNERKLVIKICFVNWCLFWHYVTMYMFRYLSIMVVLLYINI